MREKILFIFGGINKCFFDRKQKLLKQKWQSLNHCFMYTNTSHLNSGCNRRVCISENWKSYIVGALEVNFLEKKVRDSTILHCQVCYLIHAPKHSPHCRPKFFRNVVLSPLAMEKESDSET